jgi:hypothetical protein
VSRNIKDGEAYTTWFDNFSKIYPLNIQSVSKLEFKQCLWSGVAYHIPFQTESIVLNLQIQTNSSGVKIHAMPYSIFANEALIGLKSFLDATVKFSSLNYEPYSLVHRYRISSVPVKPTRKLMMDCYGSLPKRPLTSLDRFFPDTLLDGNIGTNDYLCLLLSQFAKEQEDKITSGSTSYRVLFADVNIFERVMKVTLCVFLLTRVFL